MQVMLALLSWLWTAPGQVASPPPWDDQLAEWRAAREAELKKEDGYLSVAGLHFLHTGGNTLGADEAADIVLPAGAAPARAGRVVVSGGRVEYEPAPGVVATVNGARVTRGVPLRTADVSKSQPADLLVVGRLTLLLHLSGDRLALRVRDPESKWRRSFTRLEWFAPDPRWRVPGRLVPFASPKQVPVVNVLGDTLDSTSPGEIEAEIEGQAVKLLAFQASKGRLWVVFSDQTAGTLTYPIRYVYTDAPGPTGDVVVDFNRAYNPPCAYNPHTTCPLPPRQNKLAVAIPAGERQYQGPKPTVNN